MACAITWIRRTQRLVSALSPDERKAAAYYSLYRFGRHWKFTIKKAKPLSKKERMAMAEPAQPVEFPRAEPVDRVSIDQARDWIRSAEPSLDQIDARADAERH